MSYDTEWLSEASTVGEVCHHLELLLAGFRAHGDLDRLPPTLRSISARTPEEVLQWCELINRNSCSELDEYLTLFDTARDRIAHLTTERSNVRMPYIVYVSKDENPVAEFGVRQFSNMEEAARACISLREHGYKLLRVRLPSGKYVAGSLIDSAIVVGIGSVKIALTS